MPDHSIEKRSAPTRFISPMSKIDEDVGPVFIPVWQPALAGFAAIASLTFATLLFLKL